MAHSIGLTTSFVKHFDGKLSEGVGMTMRFRPEQIKNWAKKKAAEAGQGKNKSNK